MRHIVYLRNQPPEPTRVRRAKFPPAPSTTHRLAATRRRSGLALCRTERLRDPLDVALV